MEDNFLTREAMKRHPYAKCLPLAKGRDLKIPGAKGLGSSLM